MRYKFLRVVVAFVLSKLVKICQYEPTQNLVRSFIIMNIIHTNTK